MSERIREFMSRGLKAQNAVDEILKGQTETDIETDKEAEEALDREMFEEEQQQRADEESFDQ